MASHTEGPASIIEVVGSLNMDLVTVTPRIPGPGETLAATSFATGYGGKGANQAVAAARLLRHGPGQDPAPLPRVLMTGAVGDDQFGHDFLRHLSEVEKIETSGVVVKQGFKTGTSVILVEESTGENRILFAEGANGELLPSNVNLTPRQSGEEHLVIFQMEIPIDTLVICIRNAKSMGKRVMLNTAPASPLPEEVFRGLHYLVMNESEAALLSQISEDQLNSSLDQVASIFFEKGVHNVIITLGSSGAYFCSNNPRNTQSSGHRIPGHKVERVLDTTAAGDTFCGALAVYLATHKQEDIADAIAFGNRAAAFAVTKKGAQSSMPYKGEV